MTVIDSKEGMWIRGMNTRQGQATAVYPPWEAGLGVVSCTLCCVLCSAEAGHSFCL